MSHRGEPASRVLGRLLREAVAPGLHELGFVERQNRLVYERDGCRGLLEVLLGTPEPDAASFDFTVSIEDTGWWTWGVGDLLPSDRAGWTYHQGDDEHALVADVLHVVEKFVLVAFDCGFVDEYPIWSKERRWRRTFEDPTKDSNGAWRAFAPTTRVLDLDMLGEPRSDEPTPDEWVAEASRADFADANVFSRARAMRGASTPPITDPRVTKMLIRFMENEPVAQTRIDATRRLAFAPHIHLLPAALEAAWTQDAEFAVRLYARYALRMHETAMPNG